MVAITFEVPTSDSGTFSKPAPGEYIWLLKSIEQADETNSQYKRDKPRVRFVFEITAVEEIDTYPEGIDADDDDACAEYEESLVGQEQWEFCTLTMGPNSTLREWVQGMLGRTVEKGEKFDPSHFVGKSYKVQYGDRTYNIKGDGGTETVVKRTIKVIKPLKVKRDRKPRAHEENLAPWEREDLDNE